MVGKRERKKARERVIAMEKKISSRWVGVRNTMKMKNGKKIKISGEHHFDKMI